MVFFGADDHRNDPFLIAKKWIEFAEQEGDIEVVAVNLATVDPTGLPNVRVVYVREICDDGFVFFTNYHSRKGAELESGQAAINYFHPTVKRQIRVRGKVEKISAAASDAYFKSRSEGSRLGAWVSQQSQPLSSREHMMEEWREIDKSKAQKRPPHWGGYILRPVEIEFWVMGDFRLHDRFRWTREKTDSTNWTIQRLYP